MLTTEIRIVATWILLLTSTLHGLQARRHRVRHGTWLSGRGRCSSCAPGWGVDQRCSTSSDTKCSPCTAGQSYSGHHSPRSACIMCSRCGPGLYTARGCTTKHDTKCAACYPPPPMHRRSRHYYEQCQGFIDDYVDDTPDEPTNPVLSSPPPPSLVSFDLTKSAVPGRTKSEMARNILADAGPERRTPVGFDRAVLTATDQMPSDPEYSLVTAPGYMSSAGPPYSVLTDSKGMTENLPHSLLHGRLISPRRPVRINSGVAIPTVGRGGHIRVQFPPARSHFLNSSSVSPTTSLSGVLKNKFGTTSSESDEELSPEEVGRLLL